MATDEHGWARIRSEDKAFELEFVGAEIEQQAHPHTGCFKVIQALSCVCLVKPGTRFDFYQDFIIYDHICDIITHDYATKSDG